MIGMESEREIPKSERILNEIRLFREREKVRDVDEPMEKMVIFRVAGELYAFPGRNVMEILPAMEISPIPGTPPCIPGLITVRGEIESVLDLRSILGLPGLPEGEGQILLARGGSIRSGVLIDSVEDVADVPLSAIFPPPSTLGGGAGEFVAGRIDMGGGNVLLLDTDRIFVLAAAP